MCLPEILKFLVLYCMKFIHSSSFRITLFLILNFAALFIGQYFTGPGVNSEWSQSLNKAPWTPPGWVFAVAWNIIMITYAFWLNSAWQSGQSKFLWIILYSFQWILNVSWNPVFFYLQEAAWALPILITLTGIVAGSFFLYYRYLGWKSIWILPYVIWLPIAVSLNLYIVLYN